MTAVSRQKLSISVWRKRSLNRVSKPQFRRQEVLSEHQNSLEQLEDVAHPLVVLLEVLLEKDPGRRFQNPADLLKAIPTITAAINARRRITRQSFQKKPSAYSRIGTRKPPARPAPKKISVARLPVTGSDVFGREEISLFWIVHGQTRMARSLEYT
jgi:hypothetical protein